MTSGIFMKSLLPFDVINIKNVPIGSGIYIIYYKQTKKPFYVGRSRRDIRERLQRHVTKTGSRKIAEALSCKILLEFEYEHMISVEQAEKQLIDVLGTIQFANLHKESDPADWNWGIV